MFDIGWSEMAIIALVALVVLGPKELPQAMKSFAQFSKKMRRYANEFRAGVDNIVREAELEDAKKALDAVRSANPKTAIKKMIDPTGEMTDEVKSVEAAAKGTAPKPAVRPLPPGEQVDPTGVDPAGQSPAPAAAALPAPGVAPQPVTATPQPLATRVSQPLQVAPPHSIRPPIEPAKAKSAPAVSAPPAPPTEEAASDEPPVAAEARKHA